jgi:DNA-binding MarR family transcriptional regulator
MHIKRKTDIPIGTQALIFSKFYYGVLSRQLEGLEVERYYSILYFLNCNSGCTQQFICNHLAIDKTAMVKVMEYLVDCGYVERKVNPDDRREHIITLTRKGEQRTREIVKCFDQLDKQLFDGITEAERQTFVDILARTTQNLNSLPGNDLFFSYARTNKKISKPNSLKIKP